MNALERQQMRSASHRPFGFDYITEIACEQVGVDLRHVREALACDMKPCRVKGRSDVRMMPGVDTDSLRALVHNGNRPEFTYIGSDEPLANRDLDRKVFEGGEGVGLLAICEFLLANHQKVIDCETETAR